MAGCSGSAMIWSDWCLEGGFILHKEIAQPCKIFYSKYICNPVFTKSMASVACIACSKKCNNKGVNTEFLLMLPLSLLSVR